MEILRHPEVFAAASASSPPTDWRNYDTIYTERYMWIPQENKAGYDKGSAMTYAKDLKGRLLLYYGTADNNVHPSNSMQLIKALQEAGKSFDVQVGPDQGHSGVNQQRMMEFFIENLVHAPAARARGRGRDADRAAYVVVQVDVKDPARYATTRRWCRRASRSSAAGSSCAAARRETLEGDWAPNRFVIVEFPTRGAREGVVGTRPSTPRRRRCGRRRRSTQMILVEGV